MGIFDKIKRGVSDAQAAGALAAQSAANAQSGTGQVGVSGMAGPHINPAHFGGPSTTALNADDPMLQPVEGISLEAYAAVAREARERGVTTADGVEAVAAEMGYDPATFTRAANEWIARMGKSMVVGQQFRSHLGI